MKQRIVFRSISYWFSLILILWLTGLGVLGQESRQKQSRFQTQTGENSSLETNNPNNRIVLTPNEDHRIGAGDVIDVRVNMAPELSSSFRIKSDGTFQMPYLGRLQAKGKTSEELAEEIAGKLQGSYLNNPIVKVLVAQIYSHTYFIQGAVRRSGVYQIEGKPSLLDLVAIGGGLAENHGTTAFILRRIKPAGPAEPVLLATAAETVKGGDPQSTVSISPSTPPVTYEMAKANIAGLLKGSFEQNIMLEPGDIINIPPTDIFFVAGDVHEPGSFPLKEGTTLRQAISLAQGVTIKAAAGRTVIFREDGKGQRQEIKVDVNAVMSGKSDDIPLMANDIVVVPNSAVKSAALPILSAFGNGLAFATGGRLPGR